MSYVLHCWVECMTGLDLSYVHAVAKNILQWRTYDRSKFVICSPLLEIMYERRMYDRFEPIICSPLLWRIYVRFEHIICSPLLRRTFGSREDLIRQNLSQLKTYQLFSTGRRTSNICCLSAENMSFVLCCWKECSQNLSYVLHC